MKKQIMSKCAICNSVLKCGSIYKNTIALCELLCELCCKRDDFLKRSLANKYFKLSQSAQLTDFIEPCSDTFYHQLDELFRYCHYYADNSSKKIKNYHRKYLAKLEIINNTLLQLPVLISKYDVMLNYNLKKRIWPNNKVQTGENVIEYNGYKYELVPHAHAVDGFDVPIQTIINKHINQYVWLKEINGIDLNKISYDICDDIAKYERKNYVAHRINKKFLFNTQIQGNYLLDAIKIKDLLNKYLENGHEKILLQILESLEPIVEKINYINRLKKELRDEGVRTL